MRGLLLLILAAPLIELWFIIRVGASLGAITTICLLIMAGMAGMALLRQQSFSTLLRVEQRLQAGELPATDILEGFVLSFAALLLLIPGFISDLLAIPLLIPPLRRLLVARFLTSRYYSMHYNTYRHSAVRNPGHPQDSAIIDGEFRREDDPRLH